ncbi:MAG: hypothetical protein ACXWUC_08840 [Methylosarcina sp.]
MTQKLKTARSGIACGCMQGPELSLHPKSLKKAAGPSLKPLCNALVLSLGDAKEIIPAPADDAVEIPDKQVVDPTPSPSGDWANPTGETMAR